MSRPTRLILEPSLTIGGRAAAWLFANLDRRRVREREPDDEIDQALAALAALAHAWHNRTQPPAARALPPRPLTTQDVAAMHRVHEASVRRAIRAGRLRAEQGRHGWEISPAAAQEWQPRKAREAGRAA